MDVDKKIKEIANYIMAEFKDKFIFLNSSIKYFMNKISEKKLEIEDMLQSNATSHSKSINEILNRLGFEKDIRVKVDRLGGQIKYTIQVNNRDISTLSDGQKHKLALAVFLNSIKDLDLSRKILFLMIRWLQWMNIHIIYLKVT